MDKYFNRKIYDRIKKWKDDDSSRYALLIEGARRVGKSTVVEEFARNEYRSHILIDFSVAGEEIKELWTDLTDLDYIFLKLQSHYGVSLHEHESLIIFDEVQFCPKARQAIKHLVKDGRYSYIETGSLISIKRNVEDILIPSEEMSIMMYPMDFLEFLEATGKKMTVSLMEYYIKNPGKMTDEDNRSLMKEFRLYMLIGGMPQAVESYIEKNDFAEVDKVKRTILKLYMNDFYKLDEKGYLSKLFGAIPSILEYNKSRYSIDTILSMQLADNTKNSLFSCLVDSKTCLAAYHVAEPGPGLNQTKDEDRYKLFLTDTGLFVTLMFYDSDYYSNEIYQKLLNDKLSANLGYLYENAVASQLASAGFNLYYNTFYDPVGHRTYEIDFLIGSHGKTCPIEVKSSKWKAHASLDNFSEKYSARIYRKFILHTKRISKDGDIFCLPVYYAGFIDRFL